MLAQALLFVAAGSFGGSALLLCDYWQSRADPIADAPADADAWQDHEVLPVIVP